MSSKLCRPVLNRNGNILGTLNFETFKPDNWRANADLKTFSKMRCECRYNIKSSQELTNTYGCPSLDERFGIQSNKGQLNSKVDDKLTMRCIEAMYTDMKKTFKQYMKDCEYKKKKKDEYVKQQLALKTRDDFIRKLTTLYYKRDKTNYKKDLYYKLIDEKTNKIIKCQSFIRKYHQKDTLKNIKEYNASIIIQSLIRKYIHKVKLKHIKEYNAATIIQSYVRKFLNKEESEEDESDEEDSEEESEEEQVEVEEEEEDDDDDDDDDDEEEVNVEVEDVGEGSGEGDGTYTGPSHTQVAGYTRTNSLTATQLKEAVNPIIQFLNGDKSSHTIKSSGPLFNALNDFKKANNIQ
jgi:hypothetical protein